MSKEYTNQLSDGAHQYFTRPNKADIDRCFESVKRDRDWRIVQEPAETVGGWYFIAASKL